MTQLLLKPSFASRPQRSKPVSLAQQESRNSPAPGWRFDARRGHKFWDRYGPKRPVAVLPLRYWPIAGSVRSFANIKDLGKNGRLLPISHNCFRRKPKKSLAKALFSRRRVVQSATRVFQATRFCIGGRDILNTHHSLWGRSK